MPVDVIAFDKMLDDMFPRCTNIFAEIWDRPVITNILADLIGSGVNLNAAFPVGKLTRKADQIVIEDAGLALVDGKSLTSYLAGMPLKLMVARFSNHPLHNFIRVYYDGLAVPEDRARRTLLKEGGTGGVEIKIRTVNSPGWLLIYPVGSLLCDQRLENRVRDLAASGREASLFSEFMAIDESDLNSIKNVDLTDYVPEDAKLWEQWLSKMDTNMFQTNVRPRNFSSASGRSNDYYLKIIQYANKKIGAVWLEKITQRNGTAELGLIIGEPHLWGMGLGSKAMAAMIDIARNDLGLKFLWVSVREANQRAVNCYKRGGFMVVRKVPVFNKSDGSYQIWTHMEKMI